MKKLLLLLVLSGFIFKSALAQTTSPPQTLRLARSTFEQGRLHELPGLLEKYLKDGFSTSEKIEAYKLLTQAYIYLEEPEKADQAMLDLLRTDNYFEINEALDPAEFVALYKTFRTYPLFRVGIKLGPTATMPAITDVFAVNSSALGNGKIKPKVNLSVGLVFEKDFYGWIKNFSIAPELMYVMRSYDYTNIRFNSSDQTPETAVVTQEQNFHQQKWADLNLLVQYKLKNTKLNPYFSAGPGMSYLLGASNEMRTQVSGQGAITGPSLDTKASYNKLAYSAIFSVGSKIRVGSFYLTGDIRYQLGINNIVSKSTRSNPVAVYDYGYVPSNYRQNNLTVNLGLVIPYFNPIKLTK